MYCLKLTVLCSVLCVLKCAAMFLNELEEFNNFLQKTSQLDEILKKGTSPDDDYDEDEQISDHAWEDSGKFEGDLILNERQRRVIVEDVAEGLSRNGLTDSTKRWPDNEVIYYIQKEHFSGDQVDAIRNGIEDLAQASCVKFRPYKKGDRDAVVIQGSRRGCFSQVGYQGGYQVLNLSGRHPVGRGCFRHGTVVHELLHTLGFYHMQSSPDRDDYINVVWENIVEPAKHNFRKYNTFSVSDFGVGYDYDSVLHYSRRAFSANGGDTLVPKQSGASIGQRVGLSDKDSQKLNKMYCDANNNDAAEEPPKKSPPKKKKPKNKPFEGHGIGYHQGKAIVIKLPAAETYKLADTPTSHVFDHFSKTSQTVSSAALEETGGGEKVTQPYNPKLYQFNSEDFENPSVAYIDVYDKTEDNIEKSVIKYDTDKQTPKSIDKESNAGDENYNQKPLHDDSKMEKLNNISSDLDEAFERLGKIIKTHVSPSHAPDLEVYKNADYSKFYNSERKYKPEPEILKVDKAFASSSDTNTNKNKDIKEISNNAQFKIKRVESVQSDNEPKEVEKYSSQELSTKSIHNKDNLYHDYDSSYGTSYPFKKYSELSEEGILSDPNTNKNKVNKETSNKGEIKINRVESVQSDNEPKEVEKYSSQELSTKSIHNKDNLYHDYDSSYGTTYPFKKYSELSEEGILSDPNTNKNKVNNETSNKGEIKMNRVKSVQRDNEPKELEKFSFQELSTESIHNKDNLYQDYDSSYGITYPFKKYSELSEEGILSDPNTNRNKVNKETSNKGEIKINRVESVQSDNEPKEVEKYSSQELPTESIHNKDNLYQDYDSSYGTRYPFKKYSEFNEERIPRKHFADEHYYNLYDGPSYKQSEDSFQSNQHKIIDYTVPGHKQWYNRDDIEKDNAKYNKESYTNAVDKSNENVSKTIIQIKTPSTKENDLFGRLTSGKPYSLFGVLVPLTQKWFRVNYNPQEKSLSIEDPEYSEGYR